MIFDVIQVIQTYNWSLRHMPPWIGNHMPSKVWDEITYPYLNFNGTTVEV